MIDGNRSPVVIPISAEYLEGEAFPAARGSSKSRSGRHSGFRVAQLGSAVDTFYLMNGGARGFELS
jgi:hypothetical protein